MVVTQLLPCLNLAHMQAKLTAQCLYHTDIINGDKSKGWPHVHLAMWPGLASLFWLGCTLSVRKSALVRLVIKHLVYVISFAIYSVPSLKSSPIKV